MLQFDKMYTIECLLVSFIFYSLDVRFIYYSLVFFFPCIPAGGTQVLVYTAGHTMWKASEKCYPSVKRAKHFIEPKKKKKKKRGGGGWSNLNCCIPSVWFKTILETIICFRLKICIRVIFVHFPYMHFLCKYNCAH